MKNLPLLVLSFICCLFLTSCASDTSGAGGPYYHKPAYRGRILDAETKGPLEGVVVVTLHWKRQNIGGLVGADSSIFKVFETVTDSRGEFSFPPYATTISLFESSGGTEFIIYKPGYASYPSLGNRIYPLKIDHLRPSLFFSRELGSTGDITRDDGKPVATVIFGVVELPRVTTKRDRLAASSSRPTEFRSKDLPLLFKAINQERAAFGLREVY